METRAFTPEESLELISRTIRDTKHRFQENGFIYLFWGILILLVSAAQYLLYTTGHAGISYYPYFLMPLGGVFTFVYYYVKERQSKTALNAIGKLLSILGITLGINFITLGFLFHEQLGEALIPVFIIMLALWNLISGAAIRFNPLIVCGILLNLLGFAAFMIKWPYQPLAMTLAAIIGLLLPGIILYISRRKNV